MKRTISVMACLALICTSQLVARGLVATTSSIDSTSESTSQTAKDPNKEHKLVRIIPSVTLSIEIDNTKEILKVDLSGNPEGDLDWIIFQPKGAVICRITTSSKINQIKIDALESGTYVLMLKDVEGRAIYRTFRK